MVAAREEVGYDACDLAAGGLVDFEDEGDGSSGHKSGDGGHGAVFCAVGCAGGTWWAAAGLVWIGSGVGVGC